MSFGKIKIDPRDSLFSTMIRERNKSTCIFCGKKAPDVKIENSHYWSRGNKTTRFDAENCDSLCWYCHMKNESNKQGKYMEHKLRQLGDAKYEAMRLRAGCFGKYGAYEQKLLMSMLKEDYKGKKHLEKGWLGYELRLSGPLRRVALK